MDFTEHSSNDVASLKGGFENKCALCVILTKVIENYIIYHRKNVTNFIEN